MELSLHSPYVSSHRDQVHLYLLISQSHSSLVFCSITFSSRCISIKISGHWTTLKMEVARLSETSVPICQSIWRYIQKNEALEPLLEPQTVVRRLTVSRLCATNPKPKKISHPPNFSVHYKQPNCTKSRPIISWKICTPHSILLGW